MNIIYKIFRLPEYADFLENRQTRGAPIDLADGFIHFSTADQVEETAAKHFAGESPLRLVGCDADEMGDALKWEESRGGQLFPHLYRELTEADVRFVHDLFTEDGRHQFEGLLA